MKPYLIAPESKIMPKNSGFFFDNYKYLLWQFIFFFYQNWFFVMGSDLVFVIGVGVDSRDRS